MVTVTPDQLAQWADGQWTVVPAAGVVASGFCIDSRTLQPGQIFVALRGERDGHDFVAAAAAAGAVAALVEQAVAPPSLPQLVVGNSLHALQRIACGCRRQFGGVVIGVTGSCGKTSTKDVLRSMLGAGRAHATAGNLNNTIGVPLTLAGLAGDDWDTAVVEAGISIPGEMRVLASMIEADISIITTIAAAHLEGLGSEEGVAAEKVILALAARPQSPVVVPLAVARLGVFAALGERLEVLVPAGERIAAKCWEWERVAERRVALTSPTGSVLQFDLPAVGAGMINNILLAAIAAALCGRGEDDIQRGIAAWRPGAMRGETVLRPGQTIYLDCYNANPASMEDAIQHFEDHLAADQRRLYILGSMGELGERAGDYHRQVGRCLRPRPEDSVVFIGKHADFYRQGLRIDPSRLAHFAIGGDCLEAAAVLEKFEGAVLIKGSRSEGMERLLQGPGGHPVKRGGAAC